MMREEPRSGGENSSEEPVSGPGCIVQVTRQETGTRGPVMRIVKRKAPYGWRVSAFPRYSLPAIKALVQMALLRTPADDATKEPGMNRRHWGKARAIDGAARRLAEGSLTVVAGGVVHFAEQRDARCCIAACGAHPVAQFGVKLGRGAGGEFFK